MNAARPSQMREPLVGYFASVILALFASGWLAGLLLGQIEIFVGQASPAAWQANVAAGFFLGIVSANPFNAISTGHRLARVCLRFAIGFLGGMLVQIWVFTPFTGDGMSNYMFLLLASLAIPAGMANAWVQTYLVRRGIAPAAKTTKLVSGFLDWPDRSMFVFLMGSIFACLTVYATTVSQTVVGLTMVLSAMVIWIARSEANCESAEDLVEADRQVWLALDPEILAPDLKRDGLPKVKTIASSLLPGAILFGGMMHLAVNFVSAAFAIPPLGLAEPVQSAQSIAVIATSGLALVVVGLFGALGICLAALRMLAWSRNWSAAHLREKHLKLIQLMYFRPIGRYWHQAPDIA